MGKPVLVSHWQTAPLPLAGRLESDETRSSPSVLGGLGDEIPPRCIHSKLRIEVIVRADISCTKIENHGMLVIGKYKPELSINPMTRVPQT